MMSMFGRDRVVGARIGAMAAGFPRRWGLALTGLLLMTGVARAAEPAAETARAIPLDQIGIEAGKQYKGEGLSVAATAAGAKLTCLFQRLEGEVGTNGLELVSTADGQARAAFTMKAVGVGRERAVEPLAGEGAVSVDGGVVRWTRPRLVEEYSVSADGVRQDFVVLEQPAGAGELRVELALTGGRAEAASDGARIILDGTGRRLAYNRLHVTDAAGKTLEARLEVVEAAKLALVVNDSKARYPIRIDPTFSDENWVSMGGLPGADNVVMSIAVDTNSGVVYAGGHFTAIGNAMAKYIAKWDGSSWSALGSGMNSVVYALAVDASGNLYAGGRLHECFWRDGQPDREMEREQLESARFGDERHRTRASGRRFWKFVRWRKLRDCGRHNSQTDREMGWEQLECARFWHERVGFWGGGGRVG